MRQRSRLAGAADGGSAAAASADAQDAHADHRARLVRLLDLRAQKVLGVERDRDQIGIGRGFAFAHAVEGALEFMGEGGDLLKAEHGAGALDRVQGAEGAVDQVAVVGRALEIEQGGLELLEQVGGFLAEDLRGIGAVGHPSNFLVTAISCSCLKGLVIQPVAPAALACCFVASSDSVVRMTIGTPR
jgi:hypothetical protein